MSDRPTTCFPPEKLNEMFVYHAPSPEARELHEQINAQTFELADFMNRELPRSAETTLAIRALQEARMWANAAVALYVTAEQEP